MQVDRNIISWNRVVRACMPRLALAESLVCVSGCGKVLSL